MSAVRIMCNKPLHPLDWVLLSGPFEMLPCNDIRLHASGAGCWCTPYTQDDDTLVHNSADGREAYVEGLRKHN